MGLFHFFNKEKTEVEKYYEEREKEKKNVSYYEDDSFYLEIQDVFRITGRGTVIVGEIEKGHIQIRDKVSLIKADGTRKEVIVVGIEMFRKRLESASQGDKVGLLLQGVDKNDINRGDILEK